VALQREAQAAAKSLRQFAYRGRVVPERDDERLRELIIARSYRLIYKVVSEDDVHVIAFINSARDVDGFLKSVDRL